MPVRVRKVFAAIGAAVLATVGAVGAGGPTAGAATTPGNDATRLPPLIPRRSFTAATNAYNFAVDPTGTRVAWIANQAAGGSALVVAPVGHVRDARVILEPEQMVGGFWWDATGSRVIVASWDGKATTTGLWVVGRDGSSPRRLRSTGVERVEQVDTGQPQRILVGLRPAGSTLADLVLLDLGTGKATPYATNERGFTSFAATPGLRTVIGERFLPDGTSVIERFRAGAWTPVVRRAGQRNAGLLGSLAGVNAAGTIAYVFERRDLRPASFAGVDLESQKVTLRVEDAEREVVQVDLDSASGEPRIVRLGQDDSIWRGLNPAAKAELDALQRHREGLDYYVSFGDRYRVVLFDTFDTPAEWFLYDARLDRLDSLSIERPGLAGRRLGRTTSLPVPYSDGVRLPAWVTLPVGSDADGDGRPDRPLPTVVILPVTPFGGVPIYGRELAWLLADRGYAVVRASTRPVWGLGQAARKPALDSARAVDDVIEVTRWARTVGIAAPGHTCVMGLWYGGYNALRALGDERSDFACGVDRGGPTDLAELVRHDTLTPEQRRQLVDVFGRSTEVESAPTEVARRLGSKVKVPLLVLHGGEATAVPPVHSRELSSTAPPSLPLTAVEFPVVGDNWPSAGDDWEYQLALIERFFATHLGGRVEPLDDALEPYVSVLRNNARLNLAADSLRTGQRHTITAGAAKLSLTIVGTIGRIPTTVDVCTRSLELLVRGRRSVAPPASCESERPFVLDRPAQPMGFHADASHLVLVVRLFDRSTTLVGASVGLRGVEQTAQPEVGQDGRIGVVFVDGPPPRLLELDVRRGDERYTCTFALVRSEMACA